MRYVMAGWLRSSHQANTAGGSDQASTSATVRHGTKARASGRACAASTTATGSSSSGTTSKLLRWNFAAAMEMTASPQMPTPTDARTDRLRRTTATGPYSSGITTMR